MPDVSARVRELRALDNLSLGTTVIHRLHPLVKLIMTLVFIVVVASFNRYAFVSLTPYLFYPFLMMALAELPYRVIGPRVLIALPFVLFAGLANIIFDRDLAFTIGPVNVSMGVLSMATILLKMYLCVMAALILVATTPFTDLTFQLRRLKVPMIFIMVFEMTYRYIGVLFEEVHAMVTAYRLRSGMTKGPRITHAGSFLGQLTLRALERAERVHAAMRCRGYSLKATHRPRRPLRAGEISTLVLVCLAIVLLRFFTIG
ncbi:MAG: cobalt ECF transporter T component CbiQ [Propionibacteriaceae bacterium]|nr:cobalt ECF transporter T component CbiQ [Propionibacteriaceae bacterium]